ncbi:hypothetical protein [Salinivibrio kushneri]|uniref:hypothetical protein n=1 Tax=Salinivibrio kushneri TaxID=1908198 RepID=UPI000C81D999|nr:hypothetical protein [Salinivibrio kushneri]
MVTWLAMAHVSLPLSARTVLTLWAVRDLRFFHAHLIGSEGPFRFSSDAWAVMPNGQYRKLSCVYATPWLLVLTSRVDAQYVYIWRHGLPDYHFRLIYRHCCQQGRDIM